MKQPAEISGEHVAQEEVQIVNRDKDAFEALRRDARVECEANREQVGEPEIVDNVEGHRPR